MKAAAKLSFLIGLGLTTQVSAEVWDVIEGTSRPARGAWKLTLTGSEVSGTAEMVDDQGKRLVFRVSGTVIGRQYTLQRIASGGGPPCLYRGDMNVSGKISGSVACGSTSTAWLVTRK